MSPIDAKAATDNRDSLAKTLYSRLFDWLVAKINTSIGQDPNAVSMVGVLDIYGEHPNKIPQECPPKLHAHRAGGSSCMRVPFGNTGKSNVMEKVERYQSREADSCV